MVNGRSVRKLLSLFLPLLLAGVLLVACDSGEEEGAGGGLDEDTGIVDDDGVLDDDQGQADDGDLGADTGLFDTYDEDDDAFLDEDEFGAALTDAEIAVEGQFDAYDADADALLSEDEFNTFLAEEGLTEDDFAVDAAMDGDADQQQAQSMVVLASNLLGTNIEDGNGVDVGIIDELLVDESGAIQYLIVEAAFVDETVGGDAAEDDIVDQNPYVFYDADGDGFLSEDEFNAALEAGAVADASLFDAYDMNDDGQLDENEFETFMADEGLVHNDLYGDPATFPETGTALGNTIALPWSAVEARSSLLGDDVAETVAEDRAFEIVYTSDTALTEQPTFNALILEEQGAVLDDLAIAEDEAEIPADYSYLVQVSEFDEVDFGNTQGEEIGEIEDALVDLQQGNVRHVIADVGGFLGLGEHTVAVPYGAFQINVSADNGAEQELVSLDVDQTTLENAPEFVEDDWTPDVNLGWEDEWNSFWEDELGMNFNAAGDDA